MKHNTKDLLYLAGLVFHIETFHKRAGIDVTQLFDNINSLVETVKNSNVDLISKAAQWSSGLNDNDKNIDLQLSTIFNQINDKKNSKNLLFPIRKLDLSRESFPSETTTYNINSDYKNLWTDFEKEYRQLPNIEIHLTSFIFSFHYLLKKYCSLIPANGKSTISLFDQLRLTAVISQSLFEFQENSADTFPLRLVCGDLSGIQSFLYNISSKGAAKSLRGRSFYLQLLIEDIYLKILEQVGAHPGHLIYASGGKFFMLLPNTPQVQESLLQLRDSIQEYLWEQYKGGLFLCLDSVAFSFVDKSDAVKIEGVSELQNLGELWKVAADKTSSHKTQKFKSLLTSNQGFNQIFQPFGIGGTENICAVTGEEGKIVKVEITDSEGSSSLNISNQVKEQIELGKDLVHHKSIILSPTKGKLKLFAKNADIISKTVTETDENAVVISTVQAGKDFDFLFNKTSKQGFRFFGGSSIVMKNSFEPKTFDELTGESAFKRIAYLRMDVDSLGKIFIQGIPLKQRTFATYSTLSSLLDWFFSGYINTIRDSEDFQNDINVIYAGGDDLFAVGRWDKIILFADKLQSEFKNFTGRNDITISGGISIVSGKFPIGKAAILSGEAEDEAKNHECNHQVKNAIHLFGLAANWDMEFTEVKKLKTDFLNWLYKGHISKGLLTQIFGYYLKYKESKGKNLSWKWHAAYNLARRAKEAKDERKVALDEIKNILFVEVGNKRLRFETLAMAARWAELEYRMLNTKNP